MPRVRSSESTRSGIDLAIVVWRDRSRDSGAEFGPFRAPSFSRGHVLR